MTLPNHREFANHLRKLYQYIDVIITMYSWNDAAWGALQSRPNGLPGNTPARWTSRSGKAQLRSNAGAGRAYARIAQLTSVSLVALARRAGCLVSGSHPDFRLLEPAAMEEASGDADPMRSAAHRRPRERRARS